MMLLRGYVTLNEGGSRLLDRWVSSTGDYSVKEAVEADQSLGGVTTNAVVLRASRPQVGELVNSGAVMYVDFTLQIQTSD